MAHGGTEAWNAAVEEAVAPLGSEFVVEIAFGMADRESLQQAVERLEAQGVGRIAVVRLFVSGESFRHRTEYLLGLRPDPPVTHGTTDAGDDDASQPLPIERSAEVFLSTGGLVESDHMGMVIAERVRALSEHPSSESVLILAHGMADDASNNRVLRHLDRLADQVRGLDAFRTVRIETLREDWAAERETAEQHIRTFIAEANRDGGNAIVVPFRLHGFGPYAAVLEGLTYRHDGQGLLPHPAVTEWITQEAVSLLQNPRSHTSSR
jgi:sirohydrochlorin ferrochelatase